MDKRLTKEDYEAYRKRNKERLWDNKTWQFIVSLKRLISDYCQDCDFVREQQEVCRKQCVLDEIWRHAEDYA